MALYTPVPVFDYARLDWFQDGGFSIPVPDGAIGITADLYVGLEGLGQSLFAFGGVFTDRRGAVDVWTNDQFERIGSSALHGTTYPNGYVPNVVTWRNPNVAQPALGNRRSPLPNGTPIPRLPETGVAPGSPLDAFQYNGTTLDTTMRLGKLQALGDTFLSHQAGGNPNNWKNGLHQYGGTLPPTWDSSMMIARVIAYAWFQIPDGGNLAAGKTPQHAPGDGRITFNRQPF